MLWFSHCIFRLIFIAKRILLELLSRALLCPYDWSIPLIWMIEGFSRQYIKSSHFQTINLSTCVLKLHDCDTARWMERKGETDSYRTKVNGLIRRNSRCKKRGNERTCRKKEHTNSTSLEIHNTLYFLTIILRYITVLQRNSQILGSTGEGGGACVGQFTILLCNLILSVKINSV